MSDQDRKVVFVYNADSGKVNGIKDYFRKLVRPETYQCNLCAVTFGGFGMKKEWKDYTKSSTVPMEFLHKDEFFEQYPEMTNAEFPCAYLKHNGNLSLLISQEEMNSVGDQDELMELTNKKLASP